MTRTRRWSIVGAVILLAALAYLRDPSWAGQITSGMRRWEEDPPGTRFRWTAGRASFFIPSNATAMTLPLRAVFPGKDGKPVVVSISVDDRFLADVELPDPGAWVRTSLPLPRRGGSRRFRRVDLHVNRVVVGAFVLGVMTGEIALEY